jgi:hypothetical protein
MTYELAKELKDAGFPQKGDWGYRPLKHEGTATMVNYHRDVPLEHDVYIPTLSELIEACGHRFFSLQRETSSTWWAFEEDFSKGDRTDAQAQCAPTPEEAVAKLWLALHPKA